MLYSQVMKIMRRFNRDLDNGEQPIVIIPGLPIAAVLMMAYIHGLSGGFPQVLELLKDRHGNWMLNDVHDLEFYRQGCRNNRQVE